jgi:hypothetical protein
MKLKISGNVSVGFSAHGEYEFGTDPALMPCPFCDEKDDLTVENTHTPFYDVQCETCGAVGPDGKPKEYDGKRIRNKVLCDYLHRDAFANAIALWNDRIVPDENE